MNTSRATLRSPTRRRWAWPAAACLALAACAGAASKYEQAGVIDRSVHRGADVLDFDAASHALITGGWDGKLALWPIPGTHPQRIWQAYDGPVYGLGFAAGRIVSVGEDGWIIVWSRGGTPLERVFTGGKVTRAAVAGGFVLSGHTDGMVRAWKLEGLRKIFEARLHEGKVRAVAIEPHRALFASVGTDKQVFVWDRGSPPRALEPAPGDTRSLAFSPDGHYLYGGAWFDVLRWSLADGTEQALPTDHWGVIGAMQYAPSRHVLATISRVNDSSVYFLSPETGATLRSFAPQRLCGSAIALSPDGRFLATTGDDGAVRIWDLGTTP